MKTEIVKNRRDSEIKEKKIKKKINISALLVGLYNQDLCIQLANFFTINLSTDCTEDVRA